MILSADSSGAMNDLLLSFLLVCSGFKKFFLLRYFFLRAGRSTKPHVNSTILALTFLGIVSGLFIFMSAVTGFSRCLWVLMVDTSLGAKLLRSRFEDLTRLTSISLGFLLNLLLLLSVGDLDGLISTWDNLMRIQTNPYKFCKICGSRQMPQNWRFLRASLLHSRLTFSLVSSTLSYLELLLVVKYSMNSENCSSILFVLELGYNFQDLFY